MRTRNMGGTTFKFYLNNSDSRQVVTRKEPLVMGTALSDFSLWFD